MRLREFIETTKLKGEVFAAHVGITHRTLMNALAGKEVKLTTAMKIEKATCGAVTCHDMFLDQVDNQPDDECKKQQQQNSDPGHAPVGSNQSGNVS
jgi:hypothetical protein